MDSHIEGGNAVRVAFVEWPENLDAGGSAWQEIEVGVALSRPDLLITNELPFGPWIAEAEVFDSTRADRCIQAHADGLEALQSLGVPTIITSRPVWSGDKLANEAIAIEHGIVRPVHRKHYLPAEKGWNETVWYERSITGFLPTVLLSELAVGTMLCTDLMFNEHARRYGRSGTHLIAVPRATGTNLQNWLTAGKMAAIVSGCYVVSSNRVGSASGGAVFGGGGYAFDPTGALISVTDSANPIRVVDVQPAKAAEQHLNYPSYVEELAR